MMKNRYKEKYQVGNFLFFECEKEKEKEKDLDCGGPRTRDFSVANSDTDH